LGHINLQRLCAQVMADAAFGHTTLQSDCIYIVIMHTRKFTIPHWISSVPRSTFSKQLFYLTSLANVRLKHLQHHTTVMQLPWQRTVAYFSQLENFFNLPLGRMFLYVKTKQSSLKHEAIFTCAIEISTRFNCTSFSYPGHWDSANWMQIRSLDNANRKRETSGSGIRAQQKVRELTGNSRSVYTEELLNKGILSLLRIKHPVRCK
jgi:hypothetical protein